jgi:hypothetical protein
MDEDGDTQAFSETLMEFRMQDDTLVDISADQLATTNAMLRGNSPNMQARSYATDMYDLTLPLDVGLMGALRKSKLKNTRPDLLVNVNNTHNDVAQTLVSVFTSSMFTSPRCDDEMIRLLLSPEGSGMPPIKEAISMSRLPDDFHLVRAPDFNIDDKGRLFALFFLSAARVGRYQGVFCLDQRKGIWMTIDMGDYATRTRLDYTKHPNPIPRGKDLLGLDANLGCYVEHTSQLTHVILCDDVERISPTPFAGLYTNTPVKMPRPRHHHHTPPLPTHRAPRVPDVARSDIEVDSVGGVPLTIPSPNNGGSRSAVLRPYPMKEVCLSNMYPTVYTRQVQGGKGGKGGKQCPTPPPPSSPTEPLIVSLAIISDGEHVAIPTTKDINYATLLQAVTENGFPIGTETRLHMHWRIRTPHTFMAAVYTEIMEILTNRSDSYIGPSFMGYLPIISRVYGFPDSQTTETPDVYPQIRLADRLWFSAVATIHGGELGMEKITATLLFRHDDEAKYDAPYPAIVPEYVDDIYIKSGQGFDLITVVLSFAIFMNAPVLSFVHYMYSLMENAHESRVSELLGFPETATYFQDLE